MNITRDMFEKLKEQYEQAKKDEAESFMFEEKEILVSYAKYLIEYLETKFYQDGRI